jgi:TetR/AcrR family transcriptional regulator
MKMKSSKNASHSDTRDRLLESARKVFSRKGYAASIREIAEESKTTLPSLYHYFGSKEGLFHEMMRVYFENRIALINVDDKSDSAREKIKKTVINTYLDMIENVEFVRLMLFLSYGPPQGAPPFDFEPYYRQFHELMTTMIKRGIKRGEFRSGNADDMSWVIRGAVQVAAQDLCLGQERKMDQKKFERILDIILDGFSAG